MEKVIKLSEIIESLEFTSDMTEFYYDPVKKETFMSNIGDVIEITEDELDELFDRSISLPSRYELDEYGMMESFTSTIKSNHIYNMLQIALDGKGAFRRFHNTCEEYNLLDSWYKYRDQKYKEKAIEWCEENNVLYENDLNY